MPTTRVTITLPDEMIREMDRQGSNRSRFILEAVDRELKRRRRALLNESLAQPHPESGELAEAGLGEWLRAGAEDAAELLDLKAGTEVRWEPGLGWQEV